MAIRLYRSSVGCLISTGRSPASLPTNWRGPAMRSELMLFPPEEIPETAIPVSEASPEWQEALILKTVESVRFNPERLSEYREAVAVSSPDIDPIAFLDYLIACAGGRSQ
jgi:hypothetical protein